MYGSTIRISGFLFFIVKTSEERSTVLLEYCTSPMTVKPIFSAQYLPHLRDSWPRIVLSVMNPTVL